MTLKSYKNNIIYYMDANKIKLFKINYYDNLNDNKMKSKDIISIKKDTSQKLEVLTNNLKKFRNKLNENNN